MNRDFRRLDRVLARMTRVGIGPGAQDACRAGAAVLADEVRTGCPVRSGALYRSIRVEDGAAQVGSDDLIPAKRGEAAATVLVGGGDEFYGRFQEYGTVHQPARPFVRPAISSAGERAGDVAGRVWLGRVEAAAGAGS